MQIATVTEQLILLPKCWKKPSLRGSPRPEHTNKKWRQNNYYPFGLQHQGYNDIANSCRNEEAEAYKLNGKEYEDSFGLNIYEMDLRQLDPAIGRWTVMDPVTHHDYSPYSAFDNNLVYWSDPSGADAVQIGRNFAYDGADAQMLFGLLVSAGTVKEVQHQMAALYGFDSYEDFINFIGKTANNPADENGDGGGWQKLDKSTLRDYAQKMCNCSGGRLEQFTGALFENAWHNSYQSIGAKDNYRSNKNKMKGGSRTTVPDGISDGRISRWILSDVVVSGAAWFEVKAMDGSIYNSTSSSQIKGHITNLTSFVPSVYRSWGFSRASAASLTLVTTSGVSISKGVNALAASSNIILYQYTAQYMMEGSQMMIKFQLSTQNGVTVPLNYSTPAVPLN